MCNSWFCTPELDALQVEMQAAHDELMAELIAVCLDNDSFI